SPDYPPRRPEPGQSNRNAAARHGCSVDTAGGDQFSTAGDRRIGGAAERGNLDAATQDGGATVGAVTLHKCDTATDVIAAERISNPDFQDAAAAEHGAGCSSAAQQVEGAAAPHRGASGRPPGPTPKRPPLAADIAAQRVPGSDFQRPAAGDRRAGHRAAAEKLQSAAAAHRRAGNDATTEELQHTAARHRRVAGDASRINFEQFCRYAAENVVTKRVARGDLQIPAEDAGGARPPDQLSSTSASDGSGARTAGQLQRATPFDSYAIDGLARQDLEHPAPRHSHKAAARGRRTTDRA